MTLSIPTTEPAEFTAGDSLAWNLTLADHPPSGGWTLTYAFAGLTLGPSEITPVGDVYQVRVPAPKTAAIQAPRAYRWAAYATKGAERHTVRTGSVVARANLATAVDSRTAAELELARLDAAIAAVEARIAAREGERSWTQGNRGASYADEALLRDLKRQRGIARAQVNAERGQVFGSTVRITYRRPSGGT